VTTFGDFLSCEEFTPAQLLDQAGRAADAGFTRLAISDHFHPWNDAQGNSPLVWSVIGALSQTVDLPITTLVTCPTVRMHPALTAQAAATSSVLLNGHFRLGVGTGEALNEHVLGDRWPPFAERAEMLEEAVEVMRELFTGHLVSHRGPHYTVESARLYTTPPEAPPVYVSGFGPNAAALAGRIGDGLVTMTPDSGLVAAFRSAGGAGKPVIGGVTVCWSDDRDKAVNLAPVVADRTAARRARADPADTRALRAGKRTRHGRHGPLRGDLWQPQRAAHRHAARVCRGRVQRGVRRTDRPRPQGILRPLSGHRSACPYRLTTRPAADAGAPGGKPHWPRLGRSVARSRRSLRRPEAR
jgi:G6PDH family F420-dependent oxidoreductase